jgi:hypothetical protein
MLFSIFVELLPVDRFQLLCAYAFIMFVLDGIVIGYTPHGSVDDFQLTKSRSYNSECLADNKTDNFFVFANDIWMLLGDCVKYDLSPGGRCRYHIGQRSVRTLSMLNDRYVRPL